MLRINKVNKVFNKDTINENNLFKDFSLDVKSGEFISIIGSNGAGKSSLLNLISGTIRADCGEIYIEDKEVSKLKEYKIAKDIGRVYQNPSFGVASNMTILQNLALGDNKGKRFGLGLGIKKSRINYYKELLNHLGLGMEDKIHKKVSALSGGQRQALTLLLSVMSNPKILLLDEHTAALDPKTSKKIMEITDLIVKEKNITTIMVTHNLKYALSYGNRLIMMHQGDIVLDVSKEEKENLTKNELLKLFDKVKLTDELSDRSLFV